MRSALEYASRECPDSWVTSAPITVEAAMRQLCHNWTSTRSPYKLASWQSCTPRLLPFLDQESFHHHQVAALAVFLQPQLLLPLTHQSSCCCQFQLRPVSPIPRDRWARPQSIATNCWRIPLLGQILAADLPPRAMSCILHSPTDHHRLDPYAEARNSMESCL